MNIIEMIRGLPKNEEFSIRYSGEYVDFSGDDLKELAESHERLLAVVQHYADKENWEEHEYDWYVPDGINNHGYEVAQEAIERTVTFW